MKICLLLTLLSAGCATVPRIEGLKPDMSREAVYRRIGKPHDCYLEYGTISTVCWYRCRPHALIPFGHKAVYRVSFGPNGFLTSLQKYPGL